MSSSLGGCVGLYFLELHNTRESVLGWDVTKVIKLGVDCRHYFTLVLIPHFCLINLNICFLNVECTSFVDEQNIIECPTCLLEDSVSRRSSRRIQGWLGPAENKQFNSEFRMFFARRCKQCFCCTAGTD